MKREYKICKNPDCRIKFYREEDCPYRVWNRVLFHTRECQIAHYNKRRREESKCRSKRNLRNTVDNMAMNDACKRCTKKAKKRLNKRVIIYSSKNMTQEELQSLVPSMRV